MTSALQRAEEERCFLGLPRHGAFAQQSFHKGSQMVGEGLVDRREMVVHVRGHMGPSEVTLRKDQMWCLQLENTSSLWPGGTSRQAHGSSCLPWLHQTPPGSRRRP